MKNKEKYFEEILHIDNDTCNRFVEPIILKRFNKVCSGVCESCHMLQSIWLEEEYEEPKVDWTKVKVDTPILVTDEKDCNWEKRYFAKYENDEVYAFAEGVTSWTNTKAPISWDFAKLATCTNE